MTEQEYITITNFAKMKIVVSTLQDVMEGDEYGVNTSKYRTALVRLISIKDALDKATPIEEYNDI